MFGPSWIRHKTASADSVYAGSEANGVDRSLRGFYESISDTESTTRGADLGEDAMREKGMAALPPRSKSDRHFGIRTNQQPFYGW